jgi:hypothetical protein
MCTGVAHFTVVHRGDLVDIGPSIDCPYFLSQSLDKVEKAHVMSSLPPVKQSSKASAKSRRASDVELVRQLSVSERVAIHPLNVSLRVDTVRLASQADVCVHHIKRA